jgi:hypothetical protein
MYISKVPNSKTFLLNNLITIIILSIREQIVIKSHCLLFLVHSLPLIPFIAVQVS